MENQNQSCRLAQFASPEVPVETIERWFKVLPDCGLDDIVGNLELKQLLRQELETGIAPGRCYVFYGLPGTGKTYLADLFVQEIQKKNGCKLMQLQGSDIHSCFVGVAEKTVATAFRVAVEYAPTVLWIDDLDEVCPDRADCRMEGYEKRLAQAFLEGYCHMRDSGKQVVLVGTTNRPEMVDGALMNKAKLVKVPLPDSVYRTWFFASKLGRLMPEEGFTPEEMAAATEQFCYRDLDRLWHSVCILLKQKALETCMVYTPEGEPDGKASDEAAIRALQDGSVRLTREMFRQGLKDAPPWDKSQLLEQQREYEERYGL